MEMCCACGGGSDGEPAPGPAPPTPDTTLEPTQADADAVVTEYDTNGDGTLNETEFLAAYTDLCANSTETCEHTATEVFNGYQWLEQDGQLCPEEMYYLMIDMHNDELIFV